MKVLVACEFSGVVRDAFIDRGHDAVSIDLLPTERPGPHIQGDVRGYDPGHIDLLIAHPLCTYLANSGVRWLSGNQHRWNQMINAAELFRFFLEYRVDRVAVENPIMHKYALGAVGRKYDQIIQPWQFGHGETKATCLWLRGLPPLEPTDIVEGREPRIHRLPPTKDRAKLRSITYPGIAAAMADQWGKE